MKQLVGELRHTGITHTVDIGQVRKIFLALHRKAILHTVKGKEPVFRLILTKKHVIYHLHINKSADLFFGRDVVLHFLSFMGTVYFPFIKGCCR